MFGRTRKEVTIHTCFEKQVWTLEVDRDQMEQVLINLYVNAWQAMPGGGTLRVSALGPNGVVGHETTPGSRSSTSPDEVAAADGWVEIGFRDTGQGIAPEHLPKVFEPYFTTKEVGIGLGLALTKQILEEHGGRIEISSELGKGTLVRLRLPVGAPKA